MRGSPIKNTKYPPGWATRFLGWYCRTELLEDLEGDLQELFERNVMTKGPRRARLIYISDVFKFMRLYTIRKPKFINLLIQWIMLSSYIKTSGRSLVRNKLFSSINIIGLAISMSVGLLMVAMLSDFFSYDKFNVNRDAIYRLKANYQYLDHVDQSWCASTSYKAGLDIKEELPEIGPVAILCRGLGDEVKAGNKTVLLSGMWSNPDLFSIFTFPLLQGNPASALKEPFTVVLTESSASKLFGVTDPIGKTVELADKKEYVVTGIAKDLPVFSHMRFDFLVSLSTRAISEKDSGDELNWANMWNHYVYVMLPKTISPEELQRKLDLFCKRENKTVKNTTITLGIQKLAEIPLGKQLNNSIGPVMESSIVWIVGLLSFVVIISACFNYTNLSIARSLRRSREVGIRKVIGAKKGNVLQQFVVEAIIVSLLSLVIAFIIFLVLKPYFLSIDPVLPEMLRLDLTPVTIGYFILLAIVIGLMAGVLPAIFFSKINAVSVLKDVSSIKLLGNLNIRKALIVLQYTISIMLVAATTLGYKQYKHFVQFDLGFTTENVVNIQLHGQKPEQLEKELAEMPEVKAMSESQMVTSVGSYWGSLMKYRDHGDSVGVYYNRINENYLPLHGHKLLAGRNYKTRPTTAVEDEIIVNEEILNYFKIANGDPVKAIGEFVTLDKKRMQIIGVLKNYYYGKAEDKTVPRVAMRYLSKDASYINAKIISSDWPSTLAKIEKSWKKFDDVHPLDATFYDQQIARAYAQYSSMIKIIGFLAGLAIFIAFMGLLGMVVFMTETRVKEISIRKVLGASEGNLVILLGRGFLYLLLIAGGIGLPATYFFFDSYIFRDMGNRIAISIPDLLTGLGAIMVIALIMIGSQTLKVARANPAEVLKNE